MGSALVKNLWRVFVVAVTLPAISIPVLAEAVPWDHPDGTTHYYEAVSVPEGVTWFNARLAAEAAGGYLATATSPEENDFIFWLVDSPEFWDEGVQGWSRGPWLGAFQNRASPDYAEPGGGWEWLTEDWIPGAAGEPLGYVNWEPFQPNDTNGNQEHLHFASEWYPDRVNTWNDVKGATPLHGFVIEWSPEVTPLLLELDIKPGACPNSLSLRSRGKLAAAILGADDLDVSAIDLTTVLLFRADGVGDAVAPLDGPPGPGTTVEDVGAPSEGEPCDCQDLVLDGVFDLLLRFDIPELVTSLQLKDVESGTSIELVVSGYLFDGTPFTASDCISANGRGAKRRG